MISVIIEIVFTVILFGVRLVASLQVAACLVGAAGIALFCALIGGHGNRAYLRRQCENCGAALADIWRESPAGSDRGWRS